MAVDITTNLSDEREAELNQMTADFNKLMAPGDQLTPAQYFRRWVRDRIDASAARRAERDRVGFRTIYPLLTPEEKATVDAIFDRHR